MNFINFILKNLTIANIQKYIWYIVAIAFLSLVTCNISLNYQNKKLKNSYNISQQNLASARDTTRTVLLKNGELQTRILVEVSAKDKAEAFTEELQKEIKRLQKSGVNVQSVVVAHGSVNTPSVNMNNTIDSSSKDNNYKLNFKYDYSDTNWSRYLRGSTKFNFDSGKVVPGVTTIDSDIVNTTLIVTFQRNKQKQLEAGIISTCPYVRFPKISGAILNVNDPLLAAKVPFFTWKDGLEIAGGIAVGGFIVYNFVK